MTAATPFGKPLSEGGTVGVPAIYGLPLGVTCTLDADAKTLTVDEPALR